MSGGRTTNVQQGVTHHRGGPAAAGSSVAAGVDLDPRRLIVEFCDEEWQVGPDDELGFGRDSDLTIDESNRYLHRRTGCFRHDAGRWWLRNVGSHLPLSVLESLGRPMVVLPPGVETALWPGDFAVLIEAGPARYELRGRCPGGEDVAIDDAQGAEADLSGPDHTVRWGVFDLNDDQRALLAALAEPRLRDPLAEPVKLPPNRQTALRLGWTLSKFNRKLDHLCGRLSRHGVRGLQGRVGTTANERRQNLVDHALSHQLVGASDLELLDGPTGVRR